MTTTDKPDNPAPSKKDRRDQQRAEALRANLARRKAQSRARKTEKKE